MSADHEAKFLDAATEFSSSPPSFLDDEKTRLSSFDSVESSRKQPPQGRAPGARPGGKRAPLPKPSGSAGNDERTRAVDIGGAPPDPNINDVDWDLD